PQNTIASKLGAMFINEWFLPSALVGARLEPLRYAFGATIVCRRETLQAIGGFEEIANHLADDYMLGRMVHERGLAVVLSPYVVENVVRERSLTALFFHELRWARTFRTLRPFSYALSLLTHGIPLSLGLALFGAGRLGPAAVIAHVGLRCLERVMVYRALRKPLRWSEMWLVPVRDVLSFALVVLSFMGRTVRWNDEQFRVRPDGRLERLVSRRGALEPPKDVVAIGAEREEPA
ncbi:MAG: glycosyltransferase, partial [Candidatus Rokubacteria bacterium]|nr:glycosyltransferase [Candidatus Rokubacteria bacterium]